MIEIYEQLRHERLILWLHDHMDIFISGEIIMDLKYDVGDHLMEIVRIQFRRMRHERRLYGMIAITINDIIELILLHEVLIIGTEILIIMDYGDEQEIVRVTIGD